MRSTLIVSFLLILVLIGIFFFEHFPSVTREMKVFSKNNLIKNASFENGLDGWEIDDKKDPVLLILGAKSVKFKVKPEHLNSELTLEYMPSSTYRGLYTTHVQFDMHFSGQQYPIRITYELKSNVDSAFSMSTDPQNYYVDYHLPMKVKKDTWNTFKPFPIANINEALLSEGLQEININKLDKIEGRFLTSWIFDPNSVKFKGWSEYFELEEDPYPETKEISRFDPSTDLPKTGLESLGGIPSDGNNFLNVPGKYSYIYQKIANLDKNKIYALIFDAKSESLPIHPPKVIITNRDNVPIIEKVVTPQSAQLGWVRSVVLFKPNTDEIIIKLGTGAVDGYYPFTINQYDNFKLHDVAYTQKFIDFINNEYDVNISLDFVRNIIDEGNEFSVDYSKIMPAGFANKLQEDYSSLDIPVYDISVDEYTMWNQPLAKYLMWNGLDMVENKDRRYYAYRFEEGYKNMMPATLNVGGIESEVRIKTRGLGPEHHAHNMKSLKVNYNKSEYFYLLKRPYTIETLGHFVAGQFGLVTPENELVYVRINGKPSGLALKIKFDGDALTGNARGEGYVYNDDFRGYRNIITRDERFWEMHLEPENTKYIEKYPPDKLIAYFQETLKNQDLATASNLINIDQLLKWDALSSILGSGHQDSYHNLVLYFDSTRGTFEPIPYDFRYNEEKTFQIDHPLKDFFLADFRNFNTLYKLIYEYVTDEKKLSELISFSEEYRKKTNGINKVLKQTEDLESELNEYMNNHQDRINIFKERLSQNSTVQVRVQKVQKNIPQDTSTYQIEVIPLLNEQVSSTVVKGISIKNGKTSSVSITDSNGREIENGQMEDYLPSDYFYRRKSENLWKDQYEFIMQQLKPQDAEIFSKAYTPSYAVGMTDEVYTYKLTDPVKGEALLRKIGYIKHPKRLIYYLSIPSESAINVRSDLIITVENSITGELIIPEILSDDSVLNIETQKKYESLMKIKQAENTLGLVKYDYTSVGVFLKEYPMFRLDGRQDNAIKLPHGTYDIDHDIIIPANINLTIEPGVTIRFGKNSSLVTYGALNAVGTEGSPIVFTAKNKWSGWGVIGIAHTTGRGKFSHCVFEYGNDDYVNGIYFSGMLAAHQAHVEVQNCTFQHANKKSGDDALNFKNSSSFVKNSFFTNNKFDAIDFDFMKGEIASNRFIKNGNDAIDLSKSSTFIAHNYIERSGDKCISVGEASDPTITNNILYKCYIGIIVKDSSTPIVVNNIVAKNKIGIDTYQKKRYFEGGHGTFKNILLLENSRQIAFEDPEGDDRLSTDNSTIDITYSNIPGGYKGEGNIDAAISLDDLIDSGWQHNLFKE